MIKIELTRDSVSLGDGCDSHDKIIEIDTINDPMIFLTNLTKMYLPIVAGYGHTWNCLLNRKLIATITVNEVILRVKEIAFEENNKMDFVYFSAKF